jgi:hypothetical protein
MSKAMDKFNAQEKKIQIAAEIKMKPQNDIIEAAQDKLAGINYQIDDYDAGLKKIADQEDEINKAYDKKVKALDEVQKANETIARQQQNQLSLADALAKGDIAAAARAAQEMRAQEAADALQRQRDALEKNKQDQIDTLTASVTVGGKQMILSKTDIDERKKALQDEVFNIEETLLEPAQEAVRQIQAAMREDIQALTVDGKSKIQWEELQNGVDLARTSSDKFAAAISNAAEVVTKLKDAWAKETGLTIGEAMDLVNGGTTGNVAGIKVGAVTDANANISGTGTKDTSTTSTGGGNSGTYNANNNSSSVSTEATTEVSPAAKLISDDKLAGAQAASLYSYTRNRVDNLKTTAAALSKARGTKTSVFGRYNFDEKKSAETQGPWRKLTATQKAEVLAAEKGLATAEAAYSQYTSQENANAAAYRMLGKLSPDIQNAISVLKTNAAKMVTLKEASSSALEIYNSRKKAIGNSRLPAEKTELDKLKATYNTASEAFESYKTKNIYPLSSALSRSGIGSAELKAFGVQGFANGGMVLPKMFVSGGFASGTDTVPAMLTPGEFVVKKFAVDNFGADNLKAINNGTYSGESVYNYNLSVNVAGTDISAQEVARVVMDNLKQIDSQRIRGTRF